MTKVVEQAQAQWGSTPCGTGDYLNNGKKVGGDDVGVDLSFFEDVRNNRFVVDEVWMRRDIDFSMAAGKKLLEIGHGIGSDLVEFAEHGAIVHGVDVTQEHHELAKQNFRLRNLVVDLKLADAKHLGYPDDTFDVVYSKGVLHHIEDTDAVVAEIYRVLKPGGVAVISMYHTFSAFHFYKIFFDGILKRQLFKLGYRGVMATLEHGADGVHLKPLVKTYTRLGLKRLLKRHGLKVERILVSHYRHGHWHYLCEKILPTALAPYMERFLGWYVTAWARKPER